MDEGGGGGSGQNRGVEESSEEMPPPPLPRRVVERKGVGGGDGEMMPPPPVRKAEPMSSRGETGVPVMPPPLLPIEAMEDLEEGKDGVQIMLPPPYIVQSHTGTPRPTLQAWPKQKPDSGALRAELLSLGESKIKPVVREATPSTGERANPGQKKIPTPTSRPSYEEPRWSGPPSAEYAFEVIKSGVVASKEIISRSDKGYVLLGRDPDQVDLVLAHSSLSRVHAAIQFRQNDPIAYLIDLNSTHGTFLNKKRIQSGKYTAMSVGDFVKFGESSRIYVLLGPSEANDRTVKIKDPTQVEKDPAKIERELAVFEQRKKLQEVTWGMEEDAVEEEEEAGGAKEGLVPENLSKKQLQVLDRIEAKKGKILSMQQELSNIRNKEVSSELTDGQVNRISQLEERMRQLEESIEDSYSNLRENSVSSKSRKRGAEKVMEVELDSDNDDFFDRTAEVLSARATTGDKEGDRAETENTLKAKQKYYQEEQKRLEKEYSKASLRLEGVIAGGEEDTLDSFMTSNHRSILEENLRDLERRMDANRGKLRKFGDLLPLAQGPRLESIPVLPHRNASAPTIPPGSDKLDTVEKAFNLSPPRAMRASAPTSTVEKREHPEKPQADKRMEPDAPDEFKHPSEHKKAKRLGPFLPKRTAENESQEKGIYDWKPPEDQRGDGWSKLNDKFGY